MRWSGALLGPVASGHASERISYRDAFLRELQLDPFTATLDELGKAAQNLGFANATPHRDELLDFLMGAIVGPRLGANALTFVHSYPATQAALHASTHRTPRAALRFELYCEGVELANGFNELASATEQRARFDHDIAERRRVGLPAFPADELLLAAAGSRSA